RDPARRERRGRGERRSAPDPRRGHDPPRRGHIRVGPPPPRRGAAAPAPRRSAARAQARAHRAPLVTAGATAARTPARLDAAKQLEMYTTMERIRAFETVLTAQGERYGQIFVMTSGMEAIAAGVCAALDPDDYLLSTHRTQAHAIAKGLRMDKLLAEIMYKGTGYCGGRGGRQHMASLEL